MLIPIFTLSTTWWKWATPKNSGHTNMAVVGVKHCRSSGNMQALKVHSSDNGATTWFLHQVRVCMLPSQYMGSKTNVYLLAELLDSQFSFGYQPVYSRHSPLSPCKLKGPRNRIIVRIKDITVACIRPVHRRPSVSQMVAC